MDTLKDEKKIKAFLNKIKSKWPGQIERFEFKTATVIYVYLKEGISSIDFLGSLSRKVEKLVDFTRPIILYHIEHNGMNFRSHPINWYSSLRS
ncbi:hypothetical protein [Pedobacter rhodius]|uniref:Uncharacterized protein n=1 Tax=Pedobacter rhodius TaxID=3004098 RepID=A0ABT4KW37_9SPHI|nr:hypothetical protein [Pedobacter sp. SJ11]MCZ4223131.1 hypothetical protein [Pedobacter sp. SJ11]